MPQVGDVHAGMATPASPRPLAWCGVAGPVAFAAAWAILGAGRPGYSAAHDAISRLAASSASTQPVMTAAFVAFGLGVSLYAVELRSTLPGPAWTAALATGVATLGVAVFSLGSPFRDAVHGAFAATGYVTLAALPLLAARVFARDGRKGWAQASVTVAAVSAVCLAATAVGPLHGLFQRAGLTVADAWIVATALSLRRGAENLDDLRPPGDAKAHARPCESRQTGGQQQTDDHPCHVGVVERDEDRDDDDGIGDGRYPEGQAM